MARPTGPLHQPEKRSREGRGLALRTGTGFAVLLLWTLGEDLIEDARLGQVGIIEGAVVGIDAVVAGVLVSVLWRQVARPRQDRTWPSP